MIASTATPDQPTDRRVPLAQLRRGQRGYVRDSRLDASDAETLRAMGLRPEGLLEVCRYGEPCIVRVHDAGGSTCRIALSRRLAERVLVSPAG